MYWDLNQISDRTSLLFGTKQACLQKKNNVQRNEKLGSVRRECQQSPGDTITTGNLNVSKIQKGVPRQLLPARVAALERTMTCHIVESVHYRYRFWLNAWRRCKQCGLTPLADFQVVEGRHWLTARWRRDAIGYQLQGWLWLAVWAAASAEDGRAGCGLFSALTTSSDRSIAEEWHDAEERDPK